MSRLQVSILVALLLVGCSTRKLADFERPIARSAVQKVRTTAYTHSESDHQQYGCSSARGTLLQSGIRNSAAADWSRWPVGTIFQVRATGKMYEVDDYGWALAGTNTIDLYCDSRREMNEWGVRQVTIDIVHWGDDRESLRILQPRTKHKHVKLMVKQINKRLR